jgi:FkbM family methyltransferase
MIFDEKYQVWHEPKSNQLETFKNSKIELDAYMHIDFKDKVVLDIGGCAGSFSKLAHDNGAKQIITVEPHPVNLGVLKKNCPFSTIIEAAIVPEEFDEETITFWEAKTGNLTIGSTAVPKQKNKRNELTVNVVKLQYLLDKYKPEVIKMDIEGAEFDILTGPFPNHVQEFVAEFHIFMQPERVWKWWYNICYEYMDPIHWKVVKAPEWPSSDRALRKFHGLNVLTMGWKRKKDYKEVDLSNIEF